MKRPFVAVGIVVVTGLLLWPSAELLFEGPNVVASEPLARVVALALIATSYAAALALLLFACPRARRWSSRSRFVALADASVSFAIVGVGTLAVPFAGLIPVYGIFGFCRATEVCNDFSQFTFHFLLVASRYPGVQALLALPIVGALLFLVRRNEHRVARPFVA